MKKNFQSAVGLRAKHSLSPLILFCPEVGRISTEMMMIIVLAFRSDERDSNIFLLDHNLRINRDLEEKRDAHILNLIK